MSINSRLSLLVGASMLCIALVFSMLPGQAVKAKTNAISAAALTTTFTPSADAYVISTNPGTNYGTAANLRVDASPVTRSYLRFTVKGLNGAPVQSAKLRLYANSTNTTGFTVYSVNATTWTETGITYSNAPALGSGVAKSGSITSGTWVEVNLSSYIKAEGTYNLALTATSSTNTKLASRESGSHTPQLVIVSSAATDTPTKAPTTAPTKAPTAAPTATPTSTSNYQPTFPIRAAFYYPWFPEAWTQQSIYPYTNYTPVLGYYSNNDLAILAKHIQMMQYGGIQAGIASWWGQGSPTDSKIPALLKAAAGTNFRWALYYENESQADPTVTQLHADLVYIRDHYAVNSTFLRVNGKFVVFVYASPSDACGMADRWKQANTVGAYVVLKVFPGFGNCASQPDSWHQYSPAVAEDSQGSYSITISPGFWLKGSNVRLARDLTRWKQNVRDLAASKANWKLVTTFSEWGEGTIVEPAKEWVSSSGYGLYLDSLHNNGQ